MNQDYFRLSKDAHRKLITLLFAARGFDAEEVQGAIRYAELAAASGIRSHNLVKALHLDDHLGSAKGNCHPGAQIQEVPSRFAACLKWNANRKFGPVVGFRAIEQLMPLADEFGIASLAVDNAFHYLWGGAYVWEAAQRGYIAFTTCTSALSEVVPYGGKTPVLGTNPLTLAFPTTEILGYPVCLDFATSAISKGRVQQLARIGGSLPDNSALDEQGLPTNDPQAAKALLPAAGHKGFCLGLAEELIAAYTGGYKPSVRCRGDLETSKHSPNFYFQVIHPEALAVNFFAGLSCQANLKAVFEDILTSGNEGVRLPGSGIARWQKITLAAGGYLYTRDEVSALSELVRLSKGSFSEQEWQPYRIPNEFTATTKS